MTAEEPFSWAQFWERQAQLPTDFQATARSKMDVVGFLHTVAEVARILELSRDDDLLDIGCGTGLIALATLPFVRSVHAQDFSATMVARAQENLAGLDRVTVTTGSILRTGRPAESAPKVLAYSVLQYLASEEEASAALAEVGRVLAPGGRALLAANPDPARRPAYEAVIREGEQGEALERSLALLDDVLWLDPDRALALAADVGLAARVLPLSPRIWQHFYMYDLVVEW